MTIISIFIFIYLFNCTASSPGGSLDCFFLKTARLIEGKSMSLDFNPRHPLFSADMTNLSWMEIKVLSIFSASCGSTRNKLFFIDIDAATEKAYAFLHSHKSALSQVCG